MLFYLSFGDIGNHSLHITFILIAFEEIYFQVYHSFILFSIDILKFYKYIK